MFWLQRRIEQWSVLNSLGVFDSAEAKAVSYVSTFICDAVLQALKPSVVIDWSVPHSQIYLKSTWKKSQMKPYSSISFDTNVNIYTDFVMFSIKSFSWAKLFLIFPN